ncbi:MAG: hypothetical protein K9N10_07900 [Deltaproteobacteria bacterium]|nr:hypothetical protein [Deltaproteobacteria bacterium]
MAIEDALRKAVGQGVGTFVSSETMVKNATLIGDSIYTHSKGYVKGYTVLSETSDGHMYRVTLECDISAGKIENDLKAVGLLITRKHKPRIMVIIPEFHVDGTVQDPVGETEIIKRLLAKGFKVVDQAQTVKIRYNDQVRAAIRGNMRLARKIGREHGAEVMIIGEASSEYVGRVMGELDSCRARVEARAIRMDTGDILAAGGKDASGLDITRALAAKKALRNASGELGDYLMDQILARWSGELANLTGIEVVIDGMNYAEFMDFKSTCLSSIRGVKAVHQRTFANNRPVVEIDMKGHAETLAEALTAIKFRG